MTYLDATGQHALAACHRNARSGGTSLVLRNVSDHIQRLLTTTGLQGSFAGSPTTPSRRFPGSAPSSTTLSRCGPSGWSST